MLSTWCDSLYLHSQNSWTSGKSATLVPVNPDEYYTQDQLFSFGVSHTIIIMALARQITHTSSKWRVQESSYYNSLMTLGLQQHLRSFTDLHLSRLSLAALLLHCFAFSSLVYILLGGGVSTSLSSAPSPMRMPNNFDFWGGKPKGWYRDSNKCFDSRLNYK